MRKRQLTGITLRPRQQWIANVSSLCEVGMLLHEQVHREETHVFQRGHLLSELQLLCLEPFQFFLPMFHLCMYAIHCMAQRCFEGSEAALGNLVRLKQTRALVHVECSVSAQCEQAVQRT